MTVDFGAAVALVSLLLVIAGGLAGAGYAWARVVLRLQTLETLNDLPGRVTAIEFDLTAQSNALKRIEKCLADDSKPISVH